MRANRPSIMSCGGAMAIRWGRVQGAVDGDSFRRKRVFLDVRTCIGHRRRRQQNESRRSQLGIAICCLTGNTQADGKMRTAGMRSPWAESQTPAVGTCVDRGFFFLRMTNRNSSSGLPGGGGTGMDDVDAVAWMFPVLAAVGTETTHGAYRTSQPDCSERLLLRRRRVQYCFSQHA